MTAPPERYRFGPYEIRTRTHELFKHGSRVKLRPQPFQVLRVLVERAGDVVTRDELHQLLWLEKTFVDFEHGLNTAIKELRKALCESASEPRCIETLPKLGYRFTAAVESALGPAAPPPSPTPAPPVESAAPPLSPIPAAPVESAPPTAIRPRRSRLPWPYLAIAPLLAAMLGGWIAMKTTPEPVISMPLPLIGLPGLEQAATWSPDGRQVAFAWTGEKHEHFDLYVMQPGARYTLRLTTQEGDNFNPAWSPDGRWIAYINRGTDRNRSSLNLVSPLGGPVHTVLTSETSLGRVSWLPDARAVVLEIVPGPGRPAELWLVAVESGTHRPLTSPPAGIPGDSDPAVSPDGKSVAFCRVTFWRTAELFVLDLKPDRSPAGAPRRITDLGYVRWPAWTLDGRDIILSARRDGAGFWEVEPDGRHLRPIVGVPDSAWQPALARRPGNYTSLIFTASAAKSAILRFPTGRPTEAGIETAVSSRNQGSPRYSPDGRRLAFNSDRTGFQEIWLAAADGSQPLQLTDLHRRITEAPDWSPSGQELAFVSQDRANRQIYVVGASGGSPTALTDEEGIQAGGGWSHDASAYYYTSRRSGRLEVWRAPRAGGAPRPMTANGGVCGFESAQGVFYYWKGEIARRGILMRRTPQGDQPVPNVAEGVTCRTAPSPSGFYFESIATGDVYLYEESTARCTRLFGPLEEPGAWFTVAPDGHWLAMDTITGERNDLMMIEHFR